MNTASLDNDIKTILSETRNAILRITPEKAREEICVKLSNKVFKHLFEIYNDGIKLQTYLAVLSVFREGFLRLAEQLTSWLIFEPDKRKMNLKVIVGMIRFKLLLTAEFDKYLANLLSAGFEESLFDLAIQLVQLTSVAERLEVRLTSRTFYIYI